MARAVHWKRDPYDLRIDRWSKSRWENPFPLRKNATDAERNEVIAKYRAHLIAQIEAGEVTRADLEALHGKRLGCWCAPLACHGDVIAEFAARAAAGLPL